MLIMDKANETSGGDDWMQEPLSPSLSVDKLTSNAPIKGPNCMEQ